MRKKATFGIILKTHVHTLMLLAILLFSSPVFDGSLMVTVKAQPSATLWAVVAENLNGTEYSDILGSIQVELAKIGITLQIEFPSPSATVKNTWGGASINITDYVLAKWNVSGDANGNAIWEYGVDGWDLTIGEVELWGLSGLERLVNQTPPSSYNIMPWNNTDANTLLGRALQTSNATDKQDDIWKWQRVFMHDPPMVVLYYPVGAGKLSVPLWINLNNPIVSNRYVRQAIAHAIDYTAILTVILPSHGVTATQGKTLITSPHYYHDPVSNVTVNLYNTVLSPYSTNIIHATEYMDMWWYAKDGMDYTKGPVGDADFSGEVRIKDFYDWVDCFGKTTGQIRYQPGQDTDPDWDNNGYVDLHDFLKWPYRYSFYYPENSTTWSWSR